MWVIEHSLNYCKECSHTLENVEVEAYEIQIFDISPVNPTVTEYQSKGSTDRFIEHKEKILRFLTDLKIPFENNQAERDLRMMKLQQKISGTFRTTHGTQTFCRIRAYISTIRKNGLPVLEGIKAALKGELLAIPLIVTNFFL